MKKLFTLILAGACFTVFAQDDIDYPYNPDFENDGFVGVEDVLELLSVYGTPFTPEQLLLDGASLTEIVESLQSQIDSLASYTNEGFGAIALNDSLLTEYLVGVAAASEEGDSTLGAWVMELSEVVEQQQSQLDSLLSLQQSGTNTGPCNGDLFVTYHGHEYDLVEIGEQCWFKENLRTPQYANGDSIEQSLDSEVQNLPAGYKPSCNDNCGFVYSKMAVADPRGLCPSEWHVPTTVDWSILGSSTMNQSMVIGAEIYADFAVQIGSTQCEGNNCPLWSPYSGWSSQIRHRFHTSTPHTDPSRIFVDVLFRPDPDGWVFGGYSPERAFYVRCIKD